MNWVILFVHCLACTLLGFGTLLALAAHFKSNWSQEILGFETKARPALIVFGVLILCLLTFKGYFHFEDFEGHKKFYFSSPFLIARNLLYIAAAFLSLLVLRSLPSLAIILFFIIGNLFSFDWGMSLEHHWFSNLYGLIYLSSGVSTAMALSLYFKFDHLAERTKKDFTHLLLVTCLIWLYLQFSQFIIIWMGNLPREAVFYLERLKSLGPWPIVAFVSLKILPVVIAALVRINMKAVSLLIVLSYIIELKWTVAP